MARVVTFRLARWVGGRPQGGLGAQGVPPAPNEGPVAPRRRQRRLPSVKIFGPACLQLVKNAALGFGTRIGPCGFHIWARFCARVGEGGGMTELCYSEEIARRACHAGVRSGPGSGPRNGPRTWPALAVTNWAGSALFARSPVAGSRGWGWSPRAGLGRVREAIAHIWPSRSSFAVKAGWCVGLEGGAHLRDGRGAAAGDVGEPPGQVGVEVPGAVGCSPASRHAFVGALRFVG